MRRKYLMAGAAVAAFVPQQRAQAVPPADAAQDRPGTPNVLFIAVDDLRPTLGCYGDRYAHTPNIDRIAALGTVFSHAYCQQAVSNPSRASMLTGLRPDQIGVTDLNTHFRERMPDAVTLPQFFKNNGYYVAATGKIFHSGGKMRDDVSWTEQASAYDRREYITASNLQKNAGKASSFECADVVDEAYPDGKIARDAIEFLGRAAVDGKPFFLAVGFKKPHLPFCAPAKYWEIHAEKRFKVNHRARPVGAPDIAYHHSQELRGYTDIPKEGPLPAEKEQELWRGYYACVSYMDAQLGKVLAELERLGLAGNTVIVLWGDHGYHLGEQELWCKSTNFELDTRIPLIICAPAQHRKGTRCDDVVVEAVDIYPTLADLCGLEVPHGAGNTPLAGVSLRPLFDASRTVPDRVAFSQFPRPYAAITQPIATTMGYSVRTSRWRYTLWYDLRDGSIVARELYRMDRNGTERENVVGREKYRQQEKKLAELLADYRKGIYVKK